jgi:hypothetical protein
MNKQLIIIGGLVICVIAGLALFTADRARAPEPSDLVATTTDTLPGNLDETGRIANPDTGDTTEQPGGKLKADTFTGTLESVDTGCFADGECSVEVDGNHVTVLMGWSRDTVGSVRGVEGFGDLEQYIGQKVEVYAQETGEGVYTLYGSEGFYIQVAEGATPRPAEPTNPTEPGITGGCVVGGCSSQLCVDASEGDIVSTCEWHEEYACYRNATCERQTDGRCGWTMTPELATCIETANTPATY